MADDRKPDLNLDDWDSIPLDPAADDWDDTPAAAPSAPPPVPPEPEIVIDFDMPESLDALAGADDQTDSVEVEPIDFDSALAGFETPDLPPDDVPGSSAPAAEAFDPFEQITIDHPISETVLIPPRPPVAPPPASPANLGAGKPEELDENFDAHLGAGDIDRAFAAIEGPATPPPEMHEADLNFDELTTKKVELDIDGIFLESAEPEPPAAPEPEPEPEPEPPAPPEPKAEQPLEPVKRKIPKPKLLLIAVPAVLLAMGLIFGVYKIFFSKEQVPVVRELAIDPRVPPRDPEPGEMSLEAFYVGFPGSQGDTLVEMTVVLHYNDFPDKAAVEERLATVRDLIFRGAQSKGSRVISDGEMQKVLREEMTANINLALGREAVSYVQITQIRILN